MPKSKDTKSAVETPVVETPVVETPVVETKSTLEEPVKTITDREILENFSTQVKSTLENISDDKNAFNLIRSLYKQLKKEFVGVKKIKRIKVKSVNKKNKIKAKSKSKKKK